MNSKLVVPNRFKMFDSQFFVELLTDDSIKIDRISSLSERMGTQTLILGRFIRGLVNGKNGCLGRGGYK